MKINFHLNQRYSKSTKKVPVEAEVVEQKTVQGITMQGVTDIKVKKGRYWVKKSPSKVIKKK